MNQPARRPAQRRRRAILALATAAALGIASLCAWKLVTRGRAVLDAQDLAIACDTVYARGAPRDCGTSERSSYRDMRDNWGRRVHCEPGERGPELVMLGADGEPGGDGHAADPMCSPSEPSTTHPCGCGYR